jgi:hypothetical protein
MKLSTHLLFSFIAGWVIADVFMSPYEQKLYAACLCFFITAVIHGVPWMVWNKIKKAVQ